MLPIRPDIKGATEEIDENHDRIEEAFQKYFSEPTETTVKHELGENAKGNTFPLITFCNQDLNEQELILKEYCALEEVQGKKYQELVKNC